ncbi:MAG: VanZ family protein [Bacteroidota bacterium]
MIDKQIVTWWESRWRFLPLVVMLCLVSLLIVLADIDHETLNMSALKRAPMGDKLAHLVLFGLLALALNTALKYRQIDGLGKRWQLGSLLVLAFSCLEECSQLALVSRTFDLTDMLANLIGVSLAHWAGQRMRM